MIEEVEIKQGIASNPEYSIWTSASAGSGKTTVLVKRLLRMFLSGISPSKILCITFTNTGAAEMRNKINSSLAKWATLSDQLLEEEILKLEEGNVDNLKNKVKIARSLFAKILDYSNDFKILTIHSFCQQIIKRFPLEANIIPNFTIADEILSTELLLKAKDELLKTEQERIVNAIKAVFSYKNEDDFIELLKQAINQKDNLLYLKNRFFSVDGVLSEIKKIFQIDSNETIETLQNNFINDGVFFDINNDLISFINSSGGIFDKKFLKIYLEYLKNKSENIDEYVNCFFTQKGEITSRLLTKTVAEHFPDLLEFIDYESKKSFLFKEKRNNLINFKFTSDFLEITYYLFDIYSKLKKNGGYLDYSDLIFETSKLLNDSKYRNLTGENFYSSWINYKLDEGLDHLLIDEAQDTSPIQWDIIKSITEEFFSGNGQKGDINRTIFVVGDEKQSIFSFQGAEPENFNRMLNYYQNIVINCGKKFENIYLETSFRSLKSILNITDEIFSDPIRKNSISKLKNDIKHNIVRKNGIGKLEIWPLIKKKSKNEVEKTKNNEIKDWEINYLDDIELSNKQILAETIAKEINNWFINGKVIYNKKEDCTRLLKYSDIMILVKNRNKNFINYLIRQFNKFNIPTMGNDKFNLIENIISQDIIGLLKFLLFNEDDLNLANIIKSPFFNLTEEDLYILCDYKNLNECSLWKTIQLNKNYLNIAIFLEELIENSKNFSIYELLFYIFETKKIRKKFKERFPYIADEIINEFLNIGKNYENNNTSTLLNFINFLEHTDLELKRDMNQSINEIKIITVHSAKGLESPIVILPDTNHTTNTIYKIDKILNFKENGADYSIPILQKENTKFTDFVKDKMKTETEEEYLRLLYVAITRAENELYICDCEKRGKAKENSWYEILRINIENKSPKKIKKDNISLDTDVLYIGDDDIYDKNQIKIIKTLEEDPEIEKKASKILEVFNAISEQREETKIINPSIYYSENTLTSPNENSKNIENGILIHKLLEILPDCIKSEWNDILEIYLKNNNSKEKIKENILNILNNKEFDFLFNSNSKAEVSIFGNIDNILISGKIDRLSIIDNVVHIVDYKNTNILPKIISDKYKKQLQLYKEVLSKIYTNKVIKTYILWTSFSKIEEIIL